ncbi:MAG: D-alanyl-D-alanine carboxypeptidase family protein [Candidatus Competibacterales bacterium]
MRPIIWCCLVLCWGLTPVFAQVSTAAAPLAVPGLPALPVDSYVLEDFHSGAVLAEAAADAPVEPASITKLMAAYVIYRQLAEGALSPQQQVLISEKAWRAEGSRMFIEVGTRVAVEDLIMGMVVQSGNDATIALAEHVAGSEAAFVALMNQWAERLGLTGSHFVNSTGLPHPEHYMTARDIARLVRAIIGEFPEHYSRYSVKAYSYNDIDQQNRNRLLWQDPTVDGVKTGHTSRAGYCLASSAERDGMRLIAVVLGAEDNASRFAVSRTLLNHGFRFYRTHKLYDAQQALTQLRLWKGQSSQLPLGLAAPLHVTIPRGRYPGLNAALEVADWVEAPVGVGDDLGRVVVTLDDETIADAPLLALEAVERSGFLWRMWDQLAMTFYSFFD